MKYILLFFLTFTSLFASHTSEKLEKVSLQLHWKYQFEFAGFIAAVEKGYYKDAGLNVTLKEYETGMNVEDTVIQGESEYGIYNSLSLLEYLRDKPLILVASYFKRAALVLVTSPDIKSPKDLVGKKIMTSTKEDFILNFQPYFDKYGVSVDDVELVPNTYNIDAFAKGEVSALSAFISNELNKLDERGVAYNVLNPSDDNLFVLQLELITSKAEAQNHPERVKAFRDASLKGWKYALSHKEELADIIFKKYNSTVSKKAMLQEAEGVEKLILPYTYSIGSIDKNFLHKQFAMFKKYYKVGLDKKLDPFIFDTSVSKKKLFFTDKERDFINKEKDVQLCLRYDQFPIDGYTDGKYIGIMSDIYKKISQKTSLKFQVLNPNSFKNLQDLVNNKACDILSVYASSNTQQFPTLQPTRPFMSTYFTLISGLDKSFVTNPKMLKERILLTQFPIYKKYLKKKYPFLNIKVIKNKEIMVKMLLKKEAYIIVTLDEKADYLIDKYGYGKLKINGFLLKDTPINLSLGVQKDAPILYSIMEKALASISHEELTEIRNSWKISRYHSIKDYSLVYTVLIVMGIIFLIMAYYHKKLKNFNKKLAENVEEKTRALQEINEHLEDTVAQKVDELIQKDKILTVQSKQAVMGEMISMIAHQWRQPLNTITLTISNLQIKQMMDKGVSDEELQKSLNSINETIGYLSETVDDFKTYFHPDKKKELVSVDDILYKAINFVIARANSNSVEIVLVENPSVMMEVYSNELLQVLLNILNNAIDAYISQELEEKSIEVSTEEKEKLLIIVIKDRAGGISPENIKKIFEPYFSTKGRNGTGLGLYMSQMIIEKQFGGTIEVESQEGRSTFRIQLPKA